MPHSRFALDRTAFRAAKAGDPALQETDYRTLSWQERMRISGFLIAAAWNFPVNAWPRMDKNAFRIKHRS